MTVIYGTRGDDNLQGFSGPHWSLVNGQLVYYPNGNDTIYGQGGDDILQGKGGNDDIFGGSGNDFLGGGNGRDELYGEFDDDSIKGGGGRDSMYGGEGNDELDGDGGNDLIFGDDDQDTVFGDTGDDTLDGGDDADLVVGSSGDDMVVGGSGNDTVEGGADKDTLVGGTGDDILIGGGSSLVRTILPDMDSKQDIFKVTGDEGVSGFGDDTLRGFERNLDKIEFGFDILLNFTQNPPPGDLSLKNFDVLDYWPNGNVAGADGELTDLDFPFVEEIGNDLLINLPPSGNITIGVQAGTIEYQMNGQTFNFGGGTLLVENVNSLGNSLTENDFIFSS
ncbi:MAG: calcium-binding protein [Okeania sp. SIO2C2]|uniref:calcium-binding protein n=1 Tax=Okeania sp. SIO2C2 TaxID=2607787 RepID=UPI0013B6355C|nr:calcium-binding protein [Okeania sp. SIO2C2]NEP89171.1 calcium-binding protein [Okeania sp. SIO2C2]